MIKLSEKRRWYKKYIQACMLTEFGDCDKPFIDFINEVIIYFKDNSDEIWGYINLRESRRHKVAPFKKVKF
jgi:hypothetical protein